jgi:hypothetical protein
MKTLRSLGRLRVTLPRALGSALFALLALGVAPSGCLDLTVYGAPEGAVCAPGEIAPCYTGAAGTEGKGLCRGGVRACNADGSGFGACEGEALPKAELCATPEDDDCDGEANEADAGCLCVPGQATACYSGPPGTAGVGLCKAGSALCDATGEAVGPCIADVLPRLEDCSTKDVDESCDGRAACDGEPLSQALVGTALGETLTALVPGANGEMFLGGTFASARLTIPPCAPLSSTADEDVFVAKLDAAGQCVWAKSFGSMNNQRTLAVGPSGDGGVLVAGVFYNTIDFGLGALTASNVDLFVAKLDKDGNAVFNKQWTGPEPKRITGDGEGGAVLVGNIYAAVDFGTGPLPWSGDTDVFVVRLDAMGTALWAKSAGDMVEQKATSVAVGPSGDIIVAGSNSGQIDFGSGPLVSAGAADVFLAALNPKTGAALWSRAFGDAANQTMGALAVDALGNIVAVGGFSGAIDFGPPSTPLASPLNFDAWVAKLGPNGKTLWSRRYGDGDGSAGAQGGDDVAVDSAGNIHVMGVFDGGGLALDGMILPASAGGWDTYIAKLDQSGSGLWVKAVTGAMDQFSVRVVPDAMGGTFFGVRTVGDVAVGGGEALTGLGAEDILLGRLAP